MPVNEYFTSLLKRVEDAQKRTERLAGHAERVAIALATLNEQYELDRNDQSESVTRAAIEAILASAEYTQSQRSISECIFALQGLDEARGVGWATAVLLKKRNRRRAGLPSPVKNHDF